MNFLNQWIEKTPKFLTGSLLISASLLFLIYKNPPKTLCDIQMESIQKQIQKRFSSSSKKNTSYQSSISQSFQFCLKTNSPGGCYDIFNRFSFFQRQSQSLPTECGQHPSASFIKGVLEKGLRLIVEIAWGQGPSQDLVRRVSWLDSSDMALYCQMAREYKRLYGLKSWDLFRESLLNSLYDSQKIPRKKLWHQSLLSFNCKRLL